MKQKAFGVQSLHKLLLFDANFTIKVMNIIFGDILKCYKQFLSPKINVASLKKELKRLDKNVWIELFHKGEQEQEQNWLD